MIPTCEHPQWHRLPNGVATCQVCKKFFEYENQLTVLSRCVVCRGSGAHVPNTDADEVSDPRDLSHEDS